MWKIFIAKRSGLMVNGTRIYCKPKVFLRQYGTWWVRLALTRTGKTSLFGCCPKVVDLPLNQPYLPSSPTSLHSKGTLWFGTLFLDLTSLSLGSDCWRTGFQQITDWDPKELFVPPVASVRMVMKTTLIFFITVRFLKRFGISFIIFLPYLFINLLPL